MKGLTSWLMDAARPLVGRPAGAFLLGVVLGVLVAPLPAAKACVGALADLGHRLSGLN